MHACPDAGDDFDDDIISRCRFPIISFEKVCVCALFSSVSSHVFFPESETSSRNMHLCITNTMTKYVRILLTWRAKNKKKNLV